MCESYVQEIQHPEIHISSKDPDGNWWSLSFELGFGLRRMITRKSSGDFISRYFDIPQSKEARERYKKKLQFVDEPHDPYEFPRQDGLTISLGILACRGLIHIC